MSGLWYWYAVYNLTMIQAHYAFYTWFRTHTGTGLCWAEGCFITSWREGAPGIVGRLLQVDAMYKLCQTPLNSCIHSQIFQQSFPQTNELSRVYQQSRRIYAKSSRQHNLLVSMCLYPIWICSNCRTSRLAPLLVPRPCLRVKVAGRGLIDTTG